MSDEPKNWNDALDKSDLSMSMFASKDDLIRALRADNARYKEALRKIALGPGYNVDCWIARAALETIGTRDE